MESGKKKTVTWHVDGLKPSHIDPKVNDEFEEWCKETDRSDNLDNVKVVRGNYTTIWA